jgi:hypothetical protein
MIKAIKHNQRKRLVEISAIINLLLSEFLATDPEVRVRFPGLPDFLRSSGSGTGSTQPREYNWGATWGKKVAASVYKAENMAVGIRHAGHVAPSIRKSWH